MKQNEKDLFKQLCSFKKNTFDETLLEAATPTVLGYLFFNRMQSIAYGKLTMFGLLGKVNREFRNSLRSAHEQNVRKNKSFYRCVKYLHEVLQECNCKYAMLKGAYLFECYPEGYRTSNDIDLLISSGDVTTIGKALACAGFRQGSIKNGNFVPATRKEIIESRIMRGETVPYIKEINLPEIKFLEVDLNFSLDYKPGDTSLVEEMLKKSVLREVNGLNLYTLCDEDFFIHLCSHLYKEATTLPWIEMKRDMTMYKYCDIYMLLEDVSEEKTSLLFKRAREIKMEKICAFCILQMAELFDFNNLLVVDLANQILSDDKDFLHTIISPSEHKSYIFSERNICERFFADDRVEFVKEINNEKITNEE